MALLFNYLYDNKVVDCDKPVPAIYGGGKST